MQEDEDCVSGRLENGRAAGEENGLGGEAGPVAAIFDIEDGGGKHGGGGRDGDGQRGSDGAAEKERERGEKGESPCGKEEKCKRFARGHERRGESGKPDEFDAFSLAGAQGEFEGGHWPESGEKVVGDAAGLEEETVGGGENPHPIVGDARRDAQTGENRENAAGEREKANCIDQELETVGLCEGEKRSCDPFKAGAARVDAAVMGMNPMPAFFSEPMQDAGGAIGVSVEITGQVKGAAEESERGED